MGGQPRPCGRPLGGGRNGPQPRPHTLTLARCDNVTASACPAGPRGGSPRSCREIRATPALCSGRLDCSPELEHCWCGLPSSPGGAHQGPCGGTPTAPAQPPAAGQNGCIALPGRRASFLAFVLGPAPDRAPTVWQFGGLHCAPLGQLGVFIQTFGRGVRGVGVVVEPMASRGADGS